MNQSNQTWKLLYAEGKEALERGKYKLSVEKLQEAIALLPDNTFADGEAKILLVTAYQAAGEIKEATALCRSLTAYPHPVISSQAKRILYIIEAPQLQRPKEWMSEIPDLSDATEAESVSFSNKSTKSESMTASEPNLADTIKEQPDNRFVWAALGLILLIILGFLLFNAADSF